MTRKIPSNPLVDYGVADVPGMDKHLCLVINNGKWKGTVFYFDVVKVGEEGADGNVSVNFTYQVVTPPDEEVEVTEANVKQFEDTLASILYHVIETTAEIKNADRNDGAEAPDPR
jgi:hypothetical protein